MAYKFIESIPWDLRSFVDLAISAQLDAWHDHIVPCENKQRAHALRFIILRYITLLEQNKRKEEADTFRRKYSLMVRARDSTETSWKRIPKDVPAELVLRARHDGGVMGTSIGETVAKMRAEQAHIVNGNATGDPVVPVEDVAEADPGIDWLRRKSETAGVDNPAKPADDTTTSSSDDLPPTT